MGKLEGQGWGTYLNVREAKHIYPIELKLMTLRLQAWMDNGGRTGLTHQELVRRLKVDIMTATTEGPRWC